MLSFLYEVFGFLFRILYDFIGNYGLALLIFTLFFRIILLPSSIKQQKSSAKTVRMQPKIRRIQEKYKDYAPNERNQKIQQETNELYQKEGYSAMTAGCLPLLFQLPILYGLYGIVREPLKYVLKIPGELINSLTAVASNAMTVSGGNKAYVEASLIANIDQLAYKIPDTAAKYAADIDKIRNFDFRVFGIDLGGIPQVSTFKSFGTASTEAKILLLIPILCFVSSMLTSVLTQVRQKKSNPNMENAQMMGCMMLMMPLMSLWFSFQFPAGMGMYWILSNLIAFVQTLILGHVYAPRRTIARLMVDETIEKRSYEKARKRALQNANNANEE